MDLVEHYRGNQIATDYEEYVDAEKPTIESTYPRMKKNYRNYGQGSQSIYFSSVSHTLLSVCVFLKVARQSKLTRGIQSSIAS